MITTAQITAKYGNRADKTNLVSITLPYPMRLAWDLTKQVKTMQCHRLVADKLIAIFTDILQAYGSVEELQRLGIDIFGGCFNDRMMRGGSEPSRHSWAIAFDLNPEKNQLNWGRDKALFARAEYIPMIDCIYRHGFVSLGREKNYDWMHFEVKE